MEERAMSAVSGSRELSKETLAQFAAGAEEMETQICALEATIKKHKEKRKTFKEGTEYRIDSARKNFDAAKKEYDRAERDLAAYSSYNAWKKSWQYRRTIGRKIGACIGYFFLHLFMGWLIGAFALETFHLVDKVMVKYGIAVALLMIPFVGLSVWLPIFLLIRTIWRIYDYKYCKKFFKSKYDAAQEKLSEETANLAKANETYEENLLILAKMDEQITYLENSAIVLKNNLSVYYQKNI